MTDFVIIYTDGACRGNPGPGGWGVVLRFKDSSKELYGSFHQFPEIGIGVTFEKFALETQKFRYPSFHFNSI